MQSLRSEIEAIFAEHAAVTQATLGALQDNIVCAGKLAANALKDGGAILLCGNGGSAGDSQHIAAELVGRFKKNRQPLRSIALTTDTSTITCIANDFSYDDIFSRQVEALARSGDVLIAISTSGASENVRRALVVARKCGLATIALLGKGGGACRELAELPLIVPSESTARIQEMHILIGHLLCALIEQELGIG